MRATTSALDRGLIGNKPTAAVEATGLESRHTSRHFVTRSGRRHTSRTWAKLTVVCDTASHSLTGATVTPGPSNDSPQSRPALALGSVAVRWDRVLADAAFDAEAHRRYCRGQLKVRATVIPLNRRGVVASGPRRSTGGRWSSGSARSPGGAGTGGCPAGGGRPSRRVPGTSGGWAAHSAVGRTTRGSGSAGCGCSPTP